MASGTFWHIKNRHTAEMLHNFLLRSLEDGKQTLLEEKQGNRTIQQNAAMWAFLSELATQFEARGITLADAQQVISSRIEVPWDKNIVKVNCWNPIQRVIADKQSSTTLDKDELRKIAESVQRFAADNFDIHVRFGID
jgi:DNA polymerase IIIc chi subunit